MNGGAHFESDNHVLRAGWALGVLLKHGVRAEAEQDPQGNYTDVIAVEVPMGDESATVRLQVLP